VQRDPPENYWPKVISLVARSEFSLESLSTPEAICTLISAHEGLLDVFTITMIGNAYRPT
jgi:hypothetical protein